MGDYIRLCQIGTFLDHNAGLHRLPPFFAGYADHRHIGDLRMGIDRVFDFGRIDILAAGNDHVLHPVADIEVTIFIEIARIARAEPAVAINGLSRCIWHLPIASHVFGRSGGNFANCARRQAVSILINDLQFDPIQRSPDRAHAIAPFRDVVSRVEGCDCARCFGHAVHLHKTAPKPLHSFFHQFKRDGGGAICDVTQRGKIHFCCARMIEQDLDRCRHEEQLGNRIFLDQL